VASDCDSATSTPVSKKTLKRINMATACFHTHTQCNILLLRLPSSSSSSRRRRRRAALLEKMFPFFYFYFYFFFFFSFCADTPQHLATKDEAFPPHRPFSTPSNSYSAESAESKGSYISFDDMKFLQQLARGPLARNSSLGCNRISLLRIRRRRRPSVRILYRILAAWYNDDVFKD